MKLKYFAAAIVFVVAGCADDLTPQQRIFEFKGNFEIAVDQFDTYTDRPICTDVVALGCVEQEVIDDGFRIAEEVREELDAAELAVRSAGPEEADAWVSVARAAVSRLVGFLIDKGVLGA